MQVGRRDAEVWSTWFRALGDPSRILILNLLATTDGPLSVGEIVEALDVGQSTVSHHLKLLAQVGFVHAERRGTTSLYTMNHRCLDSFPSAAEFVMGRLPLARDAGRPPWLASCERPVPRGARSARKATR